MKQIEVARSGLPSIRFSALPDRVETFFSAARVI
jgi:hypothetical protein